MQVPPVTPAPTVSTAAAGGGSMPALEHQPASQVQAAFTESAVPGLEQAASPLPGSAPGGAVPSPMIPQPEGHFSAAAPAASAAPAGASGMHSSFL